MRYSKILLFSSLSFIGGVFISSFFAIPKFIIWELFILGVFYTIFFLFFSFELRNRAQPEETRPPKSSGSSFGKRSGLRALAFRNSKFLAGIAFGLCLIALGFGLFRGSAAVARATFAKNLQGQPPAASYFSSVKEKFREVINSNLPNPQSAILSGILLGDKLNISKEWKQKLANTGTSHIVAVSGMNIVMLAEILIGLAGLIGLFRQQALWLSLILIWLFIALIGFQASAIRAGIMGSILIFCQILGRQGASFRALCLAISIMLAIQPELLRYSLSFQLSVLATLGLIQIGPIIQSKVKSEIISAALSAQVFTLPLLIYSFGCVSLVGLVVNILIVPLLPTIMVLGIIFLVFGLLNSGLAIILAWPVGILLSVVVWLIGIFSKIPFSVLRF